MCLQRGLSPADSATPWQGCPSRRALEFWWPKTAVIATKVGAMWTLYESGSRFLLAGKRPWSLNCRLWCWWRHHLGLGSVGRLCCLRKAAGLGRSRLLPVLRRCWLLPVLWRRWLLVVGGGRLGSVVAPAGRGGGQGWVVYGGYGARKRLGWIAIGQVAVAPATEHIIHHRARAEVKIRRIVLATVVTVGRCWRVVACSGRSRVGWVNTGLWVSVTQRHELLMALEAALGGELPGRTIRTWHRWIGISSLGAQTERQYPTANNGNSD